MGAVSDVQDYLEAQGLIGSGTGWHSVRRRLHDQQDQMVALSEDGGPEPEQPASSGLGSAALADAGVQVMVRGTEWDSDSTESKAAAILDALHGLQDTTLGATTYLRVRAMTTEPVFAGFDDDRRPIHTVAIRLMRDEN